MSNKFCRFLSNGRSIHLNKNKIEVKPCCWYKTGENFNIKDSYSFFDIDTWTSACETCQQQETAGLVSFRQASFDVVSESENYYPKAIDINLDFRCNAACVICNQDWSSTWHQQNKKINLVNESLDYTVDQHLDFILNNVDFSHVQRIKFFGGEPLLTDTHLKVLEKITQSEQCDIWYTTNGSILPDSVCINQWKKFRLVYVEISLDGIGDRFNYLRWPLQWKKIEKNLQELKQIVPVNVLFRINHTVNPFNVFYYKELEQWVQQNFSTNRLGDPVEINLHPAWGTWDLSRTPNSLRTVLTSSNPAVKLLEQCSQSDTKPIENFINRWDTHRGVDWKTVFPDIVDYFNFSNNNGK